MNMNTYYATNFANWSSEINLKDVTHGKKDCQCRKMSLSENVTGSEM